MFNILWTQLHMFVLAVVGFWLAVVFLDTIFQSCMLPPYLKLLNEGRLKVKPGYLQLYTTYWNRKLQKWGCWRPKLQKIWFRFGTMFSCLLMPISVIILLSVARNAFAEPNGGQQIIQPVLLGVNLPLSEIVFYLATLFFCSVTHELGHAFAATREDVKVEGIGFFFLGIFPGAYVSLPTDQVVQLSPWQQLQIFCAGVWHNVALALVSYLLLASSPYSVLPLYQTGNGVTCVGVLQGSGVSGPAGLKYNDKVISIYTCSLRSKSDWYKCIEEVIQEPQRGFCISPDFYIQHNASGRITSEKNCCVNLTTSHLCFELGEKFSCLPVRKMLQTSPFSCSGSEDCDICAKPVLDDRHRLLKIGRRDQDAVLFVGNPLELKTSVEISNYISRLPMIPVALVIAWEKLLNYILAFSSALAVLNVVPCWGLDGQWITKSLIDLTLKPFVSIHLRQKIEYVLIVGGTALIVINVFLGVYSVFR